jgi:uncharacterized protein (TIGR01777 family)
MIGETIAAALRARGDEVAALRRGSRDGVVAPDVWWDPAAGSIDVDALAAGRFDAVIHLAGEPILGRWNDEKRARIRDSRVSGTTLLAESIAGLNDRPGVFVCASAVGLYGDRGEELLTERSPRGNGFLADVVDVWEASADPARSARIRTVHLRAGAVQSPRGGALKEQLLPFRLGVGGPIGSGRQWAPWVGVTELARIFLFAIDTPELDGIVNAVGPTPARASEYAKALARELHRPTFMKVPAFVGRAIFGALVDDLILASQKIVPAKLEGAGYEFLDRTIAGALHRELSGGSTGADASIDV